MIKFNYELPVKIEKKIKVYSYFFLELIFYLIIIILYVNRFNCEKYTTQLKIKLPVYILSLIMYLTLFF